MEDDKIRTWKKILLGAVNCVEPEIPRENCPFEVVCEDLPKFNFDRVDLNSVAFFEAAREGKFDFIEEIGLVRVKRRDEEEWGVSELREN